MTTEELALLSADYDQGLETCKQGLIQRGPQFAKNLEDHIFRMISSGNPIGYYARLGFLAAMLAMEQPVDDHTELGGE